MTSNPVADRYASVLFELVNSQGRVAETLADLTRLQELVTHHADLRHFLLNPDVEVQDKLRVLERLGAAEWSSDVRAFVQVVLAFGRAEALGDIVEGFRDLVDVEQRRVRVVVRSARPLSAALKTAITSRVEQLEHRQVALTEETDPELIGGLQLVLDRRMFDGSLKTRVSELRQRLKRVRVY